MMLSVLALLGWMWMTPPCEAGVCRCAPPADVPSAVASAEAVFTGTVVAVHDTTVGTSHISGRAVTLRVDRAWKGVESATVVVLAELGGGRCRVQFELGESYLVYADGRPGELLRAGFCGRTKPLDHAAADLHELGEPARRWPG